MRKRTIVLLLFFLTIAIPAGAEVVNMEVDQIDNLAVTSNFNVATGQLTWSKGGVAKLYDDGGAISNLRVNVSATFSGVTDLSSGGLASASFSAGNFNIDFFSDISKQNYVGSVAGEIYPGGVYLYNEGETQENPSRLYGSAPMRLTSWTLAGYTWAESLGSMGGVTATTTNLTPTNISDYQSDWSSKNTIVKILADETGIPEPATVCLLGLGAAGLISRRKRA
jgi:hypothetical protein